MIDLFEADGTANTKHMAQAQLLISALHKAMHDHAADHEFSDAAVISALGSLLVWACNRTGCKQAPLLAGLAREIKQ